MIISFASAFATRSQVLVFLMSTLKASIFRNILMQRPVAVEHYIEYLRSHGKFDQLDDLFSLLGRHEDAAVSDLARR